jgi:iron-sulfur cluster repair protein YtfE (RIC family)
VRNEEVEMETITQPIRDEHRELLPKVERIRRVADSIGVVPLPLLRERIAEVRGFLVHELIPHARAEDVALYPVVARVMGAPEATATMHHDHVEVAGLAEELDAIAPELEEASLALEVEHALRRILYGLYVLIKVHFVEEEEIYLPLLEDRLDEREAGDMIAAIEAAAAREKARAL